MSQTKQTPEEVPRTASFATSVPYSYHISEPVAQNAILSPQPFWPIL